MMKLHQILLGSLVWLVWSCQGNAQESAYHAQAVADSDSVQRITLLFAGDMMQHMPQINAARQKGGTYDYALCFEHVRERISRADLAVTNLEVTLAGAPYSGYPQFCAPDAFLEAIKGAGFDLIMTANNHSADKGRKGIERTIDQLDRLGLPHFGTYKDAAAREAQYPLVVEKNGFRLVMLNYTYGTNGLPVPKPNIVNLIDREQMAADIAKAKTMQPDAIFACMHWGEEYQLVPSKEQTELADWLFEQGVTHIIGGHPHVVQHVEVRTDAEGAKHLLAYSLGNYISNQSRPNTDGGMTVEMTLEKKGGKTQLADCDYYLTWVARPPVSGRRNYVVYPTSYPQDKLNSRERGLMKTFTTNARALFKERNKGIEERE